MWNNIEDIIEFIAGYRDKNNLPLDMWNRTPSSLSLARYDKNIIDSLASQTADSNRAYTPKQSQLAQKLVQKYRRQLAKQNLIIDEDINLLKFKLGIRFVDQSKTIKLHNGQIIVKFPYNQEHIKDIKQIAASGLGAVVFDHENRIWKLALTEYIINYVVAFGKAQHFEIDPELIELLDKIIAIESISYKIELVQGQNGLEITNAAANLTDYVCQNLGGLTINNLYRLVDYSSVLGYSIHKDLIAKLETKCNEFELNLLQNRKFNLDKDQVSLENILDYARKANRLPIHIYDTTLPKKDTNEIIYLNTKKHDQYIKEIKLLVSMSSVLVGYRKQDWIKKAQKVIFIT